MLIVFGGLPGAGKTALASHLAGALKAVYLRIDEIEQALRSSGALAGEVGPAGYAVAYALASSNLRLGHTVVADSVNPIAATRNHWRRIGEDLNHAVIEIEVICSDLVEHRRRIESRRSDIAGLTPPDWPAVESRAYDAWDRPRVIIDTAGRSIAESQATLDLMIKAEMAGLRRPAD